LLNHIRNILTLFAGFALGIHVAVFLHELGHALGIWIGGGTVTAIVMMAPLPAGTVEGSAPNPFPNVWGGVAFGTLCTLAPLLAAWRLAPQSPVRFAALMVAAFCLAHNAIYLFVGSFAPFGDARNMILLGAPRLLLFVLGLPLLIGFVVVLSSAIQAVGLRPTDSAWKWIVVVELGLLPVPALTVIPLFSHATPSDMKLSMSLLVATYAACFAIAARRARAGALSRGDPEISQMPQRWWVTVALFAAAVLFILVEWVAFRPA